MPRTDLLKSKPGFAKGHYVCAITVPTTSPLSGMQDAGSRHPAEPVPRSSATQQQAPRRWISQAIILAIALLSAPHVLFLFQPFFMDERPILANVITFFAHHTIIPVHTNYPTFYSYLASPFIAVGTLLSFLAGPYNSIGETVWFLGTVTPLRLALPARVLSLSCFLLTAGILSNFCSKRFGDLAGLMVPALLVTSPAFFERGSYALPDSTVLLLCALSLIGTVLFVETFESSRSVAYLIVAAAFSGLAISTKYNALSSVAPVGFSVAYLSLTRALRARHAVGLLLLSAAVCVTCFLLGSPGWLLSPQRFLDGLEFEINHAEIGHIGASGIPVLGQLELLTGAPIVLIGSIAGLIAWARTRDAAGWVAGVTVVSSLGLASTSAKQSIQYLYPAIPGLLVLVAVFARMAETWRPRVITAFVVALSLLPFAAVAYDEGLRFVTAPNTTALATTWMYENVPAGTSVAVDWGYVPQVYSAADLENLGHTRGQNPRILDAVSKTHRPYDVVEFSPTSDWLTASRASLFVTSDAVYGRFFEFGVFTGIEPTRPPELANAFRQSATFYRELFSSRLWTEVAVFDTGNGPVTRVFRRSRLKGKGDHAKSWGGLGIFAGRVRWMPGGWVTPQRRAMRPSRKRACVTPSVTIGSARDAQDATRRTSIRRRYLA